MTENNIICINKNEIKSLEKEISELEVSPGVYAQGIAKGMKSMLEWLEKNNINKSDVNESNT